MPDSDPAPPDDRPAWLREQLAQRGDQAPGQVDGQDQRQAACYRHPEREARLRCTRCGRPVCGECAQPAAVGQLCPDDARKETAAPVRPERRTPVVTWTILGINLFFLVVEAVMSGGGIGIMNPNPESLCRLGALNSAAIAESGQWWRLFTVMVLHGGIVHFALNSWALWIFGPVLERTLGRVRFLLLYLVSGFVASAVSFAFNKPDLAVGASGAIFGLLGALIAFFWRRRAMAGSRAQLQSLIIVLVLNLILGARIPGVDNMAHIGGLIGGFTTMLGIDLAARRRDLEAVAMALPVAVGIGLVAWGVQSFPGGFNCVGFG